MREVGIKKEGVSFEADTPGPVDGNYRFLPPFFFPPLAVFFAILPPRELAAQLVYRFRGVPTGGLSRPPSYKM
jgi:hypothetical protein